MPTRSLLALQLHLLGGVDLVDPALRRPRAVGHAPSERAAAALARSQKALLLTVLDFGARAHCPRCGMHGEVLPDFGLRPLRGRLRPQSWCRRCRSTHQEVRDVPPPWAALR